MRQFCFLIFFILSFPCLAQQPLSTYSDKLSPSLKAFRNQQHNDSVQVILVGKLKDNNEFNSIWKYEAAHVHIIKTTMDQLHTLVKNEAVLFADLVVQPKEELTTGIHDLATNKVNTAHAIFPLVNGNETHVSVKENKYDTTDIDFAARHKSTGLASAQSTAHASIMATIIAGAGNSSPFALGVAPSSMLSSSSFNPVLPESNETYQRYVIKVQNHSYGTVVQNYYGAEALAFDRSVKDNPSLVHVFSAGNTGHTAPSSGMYTGIPGFANLTGNFKMAKNILVVGGTDSFYAIPAVSSKGPAYDGRIVPSLVAFGVDGSSGAAALVSGAAGLVQHAYVLNHSKTPEASLVKAILINSADEAGPAGIDFQSGYGSLNVKTAVATTIDGNFHEGATGHAQTQTFPLFIPPNTQKVKVTLVWTDLPAAVNAQKALVNDLDLRMHEAATGEVFLPWVLNMKPHADSLQLPPVIGNDTLNTVEQITIEAPAPGNHTITVKGSRVEGGTQHFSIAYSVEGRNKFDWTFPMATDIVQPAKENILRWETNATGAALIDVSVNGQPWQTIAHLPDVGIGYARWQAPFLFATAILRMRTATQEMLSDSFVISSDTRLELGFHCADSFLLNWSALPVNQYKLYKLEGAYLQPFMTLSDTFAILSKKNHPQRYYSVSPVINGRPGLRSFILNYPEEGTGCYVQSFFVQLQSSEAVLFTATMGTLYNLQSVTLEKKENDTWKPIATSVLPLHTSLSFSDSALRQGVQYYRLRITLKNGQVSFSETIPVYHLGKLDLIVFPNPAPRNAPVHMLTGKAGRLRIQVFSSSGQWLREIKPSATLETFPVHLFSKGLYILLLTDDEGRKSTQKLVVF